MAAFFLLSLYYLIFFFSAQNGDQSSSLSYRISGHVVDVVRSLTRGFGMQTTEVDQAAIWEKPIRKLAHLTEYACMGVLVYTMWRPWWERGRRLYLLVLVWVFTSAAADEVHQRFVPGRYGSFSDVLLDTVGGICGIVVCVILERIGTKLYQRWMDRKNRRVAKVR